MLVVSSVPVSSMAPGETFRLDGTWLISSLASPEADKVYTVRLEDGAARLQALSSSVDKVSLKAVPA